MNILVTGGAGFIASHIVDALIDEGHSVAVLDNLTTGHIRNINPIAKLYEIDLLEHNLARVFEEHRPEIVYHHAAQIEVSRSVSDPQLDAEINVIGSIRLLEMCKQYEVRKIIYASSAAIYGHPTSIPILENHPIQPLTGYGISKFTAEQYIEVYARLYGLDYTILRYANVYGERQNAKGEAGVVSIFVEKLINQVTPFINGDGQQTRDFIYVKDIVSANLASIYYGSKGKYNISTNVQTSISQLFDLLCNKLQMKLMPEYVSERDGDIAHSRLANSLAQQDLHWKPQFSLSEGLARTVNYSLETVPDRIITRSI
jgi:UDP-glucose 4-epimerase